MAQNNQTQTPSTEAPKPPVASSRSKMARVDLVNVTRATRFIDAGDEAHTRIGLEPGEVKRDVEVAEWVARELRSRTKGNRTNADLHVYPAGKAPDPSVKADEDEDDEDDE